MATGRGAITMNRYRPRFVKSYHISGDEEFKIVMSPGEIDLTGQKFSEGTWDFQLLHSSKTASLRAVCGLSCLR